MVKFDPKLHVPVTDKDRKAIENALWEGWELMVDETTGEVWIGNREEKIATVTKKGYCGNCACAEGIEGKSEMVGCREDGRFHNSEEENACYCEDKDTYNAYKAEA